MAVQIRTLSTVAETLDKMSDVQVDTKLLNERLMHMDRDLQESFARVHKRIDEEAAARRWLTRLAIGTVSAIIITAAVKGIL